MGDVIVFEHIGKTGGTSLRHSVMEAVEPERVLLCYGKALGGNPRCLLHREFEEARDSGSTERWNQFYAMIDRLLAEDARIELVFGHLVPSADRITSRDARHFTMMRHPHTRVLSLYHHRLRQWPDETPDFESWVKGPKKGPFARAGRLEDQIERYERYEKILFYEEYFEGLAYMSEVLGVELKEQRQNIHPKVADRSAETDRLIDECCPDMLRLYDHFWSNR
jgi:hypothetical protein